MTSKKHTPGPWEASRDAVPDYHTQVTVYAESNGERVATVFQTQANARLIAAAPDLLEACQKVLGALNHGTENPHWPHIDRLREAIAKAEGDTHA